MSSPVAPASSAQPPEASDGDRPRKIAKPLFPDWLPWEKILIWGLFFLVVYTLRHFFFIIFMTFIGGSDYSVRQFARGNFQRKLNPLKTANKKCADII